MIKKLKNLYYILVNIKILSLIANNIDVIKILEAVFKMVESTASLGKPHMTKIALININEDGEKTKIENFVTLWAGAHDGNPLIRLEQVLSQRNTLKEVVQKMVDKLPEENKDKKKLQFVLDTFN